jgi:hypothetical protein
MNRKISLVMRSQIIGGLGIPARIPVPLEGNRGWLYKLTTLSGMETLTLTVEPPQALDGKDLNDWLAVRIKKDSAKRGTVVSSENTQNKLLGIREVFRSYRDAKGHEWQISYLAFPLHERQALFCYIATNLPPSDAAGDYFEAAGKICGVIARNADKGSTPVGSSPR